MSDFRITKGLEVPFRQESMEPGERLGRVLRGMDRYNATPGARVGYDGRVLNKLFARRPAFIPRASSSGVVQTWGIRPPSPAEVSGAVSLARRVDAINVAGQEVTKVAKQAPPGRMNVRRLIAGRVQEANGMVSTAKPFMQRRVDYSPRTRITAGFVLDISGSMEQFSGLGASLAWTTHAAVSRVAGQTAMVGYSNEVFPLSAPGEPMPGVVHVGASAGYHDLDRALVALDAATDMWDTDGARVMFLFGDGEVGTANGHPGSLLMQQAAAAGVHVVWIAPHDMDTYSVPMPTHSRFRLIRDAAAMPYSELIGVIGDAVVDSAKEARGL